MASSHGEVEVVASALQLLRLGSPDGAMGCNSLKVSSCKLTPSPVRELNDTYRMPKFDGASLHDLMEIAEQGAAPIGEL